GFHTLAEGRERVVRAGELVDGDAETHRDRESLDDVARAWRDYVQPEHAPAGAVEDDLVEPVLRVDVGRPAEVLQRVNDGLGFEIQLLDVRTASRGEPKAVELDLLLHAALARCDRRDIASVPSGDLRDEAAEDDRNSLVREGLAKLHRGVVVGVRRNLVDGVD